MNYEYLYEKSSPIKLFFKVAIPSIISMLMASLYFTIEGVLVGQLMGGDALAAINLVLPLIMIGFSIADLIGVGSSVPIAICLGEKDEKTANEIFSLSCCLIILSGFITGSFYILFSENILRLMGAEEHLISLAMSYIKPLAIFSPLLPIFFAVDNYLRICGKIKYSMYVNITMAIVGCVFEFLFLYVLRLGIWASSLSLCLSLFVCIIIAFYPFFKKQLQLKFVKPKVSLKIIKKIVANGSPTMFNSISSRLIAIFLNISLLKYGGDLAVAAYSVIIYIDGIIVSLLYGLSDSLQPAIGYNYGAKNYKRINELLKICYTSSSLISLVLIILTYFFGDTLISLFVNKNDTDLLNLTGQALKLFAITFTVRWFASATQSYFTAISKPKFAIAITTTMTFIMPITLLLILPNIFGLNGIWIITPISATVASIISLILFIKNKKTYS